MQATSLIIFLVLVAFATDVWCRRSSHLYKTRYDEKIVGGSNDTVQNVPYIVYLLIERTENRYIQCGGSIISENYVLTAAHCIRGLKKAYIRAGSAEAGSGGKVYTSAALIPHPSYNSGKYDIDIGLIRTTKPIRLDGVTTKAIQLPDPDCDVTSGTNIKVSGWGLTKENGQTSSNLQSVVVKAVSNSDCSKQLGFTISDCQFCAGVPEGGKDSCQGDSGGPGVVSASARSKYSRRTCSGQNGKQVGIVSSGIGCARPLKPGIYTKISCNVIRSWIKRTAGV